MAEGAVSAGTALGAFGQLAERTFVHEHIFLPKQVYIR